MLGSHLSIAGGMVNALLEARRLRLECVQVFTRNQRQWRASPMPNADGDSWRSELARMQWDSLNNGRPARVVSHNSYLINLASPSDELWRKSIEAQRDEIERCESLRIPLCVIHPGAHLLSRRLRKDPNVLDDQPARDELKGLKRIVKALDRIHRELPGYRTTTCLETTVGSGTNLGYSFRHLAFLRANVREPDRVGFCVDTCHVTAAGYDMSTPERAAAVLEQFDDICGLKHLRVFHLNDSMGAVGSRVDRHAHIGHGTCGLACFRTILNHPRLRDVPMILETPKETNDKGVAWDVINVRRLKRMRRTPVGSR
jgi:deoxyribonuclease-4